MKSCYILYIITIQLLLNECDAWLVMYNYNNNDNNNKNITIIDSRNDTSFYSLI